MLKIQPVARMTPVAELVQSGAFVALGRCRCRGARKQIARRYLDVIAYALAVAVPVESTLSALVEFRFGSSNERIDVFETLGQIWTWH